MSVLRFKAQRYIFWLYKQNCNGLKIVTEKNGNQSYKFVYPRRKSYFCAALTFLSITQGLQLPAEGWFKQPLTPRQLRANNIYYGKENRNYATKA